MLVNRVGRVGLVSLTTYINYGNRLQLYATKKLLEDKGFNVDVLVFDYKKPVKKKPKKKKTSKKKIQLNKARSERIKTFKKWSDFYLFEKVFSLNEKSFDEIINTYKYIVIGSDQTFNPVHKLPSPIDFFQFFPHERKISFASSFGVDSLPDAAMKAYKNNMNFKAISVRENSGADIINKILGYKPPVLIDPVMNLFPQDWEKVIKKTFMNQMSGYPDGYIFTYFLGLKTMSKLQEKIKRIAGNKFEIVQINDYKEKDIFKSDPSEFIGYIENAKLIFTNSFHGLCFSILFEKPFIVCPLIGGEHLNTRIDNLLDLFNLQERKLNNINNLIKEDKLYSLDYNREILINEINKSHKFIEDNLEVEYE